MDTLRVFALALTITSLLCFSSNSYAGVLPIVEEPDDADLAVTVNVAGSYDAGTKAFEVTSGIGTQLVRANSAGTLNPFVANFSISNVTIDGSTVTSADDSLKLVLANDPINVLAGVYGALNPGDVLLQGKLLKAIIGNPPPPGSNKIEIAFQVTGGILAGEFTDANSEVSGIVLNVQSGGPNPNPIPDDFGSTSFTFGNGSLINIKGALPVPEPGTLALAVFGAFFAGLRQRKFH